MCIRDRYSKKDKEGNEIGTFTYIDRNGNEIPMAVSKLKEIKLKEGGGSSGGSKWDDASQGLYRDLFRNYAFQYTGVEKTINTNDQGGYFVSGKTTKYTGPRGGGGGFKIASKSFVFSVSLIASKVLSSSPYFFL